MQNVTKLLNPYACDLQFSVGIPPPSVSQLFFFIIANPHSVNPLPNLMEPQSATRVKTYFWNV